MDDGALTHALLSWVASQPRSYDETLEAWKTSCPRLSIWDDAVGTGLVRVVRVPGTRGMVELTAEGRELLERRAPSA